MKAPIYNCRDFIPNLSLVNRLKEAVATLEEASKTNKLISKGNNSVGYGVDQAEKAIAADTVISIARQIKASKAW